MSYDDSEHCLLAADVLLRVQSVLERERAACAPHWDLGTPLTSEGEARRLLHALRTQGGKAGWAAAAAVAVALRGCDPEPIPWRMGPDIDDREDPQLCDLEIACMAALHPVQGDDALSLGNLLHDLERVPLAAVLWAACVAFTDFTPLSLLTRLRGFALVDAEHMRRTLPPRSDPFAIKEFWRAATIEAERAVVALANARPELETGVIFQDARGEVCWPEPEAALEEQGLGMRRFVITWRPPAMGWTA